MPDRKKHSQDPKTPEDFVIRWYRGERFAPSVYAHFGFFDEADALDFLGTRMPRDPRQVQYIVDEIIDAMPFGPTQSQGYDEWEDVPSYYHRYPYSPFPSSRYRPSPEEEARWKAQEEQLARERAAGYYKPAEVESFLQDIQYAELPQDVRDFFTKEFAPQIQQDPGLVDYVNACRIDFKLRGPEGQTAEHIRDQNRIEWYGHWRWDADRVSKILTPPEVREKFIDRYLNMTLVHELTHFKGLVYRGVG